VSFYTATPKLLASESSINSIPTICADSVLRKATASFLVVDQHLNKQLNTIIDEEEASYPGSLFTNHTSYIFTYLLLDDINVYHVKVG